MAASVALGAGLAVAPSASAGTYIYCGYAISPGSWCSNGLARNYGYNEGYRPQGSSVYVCQRTVYHSNGGQHQSSCAYSWTGKYFAQGNTTRAQIAQYANGVNLVMNGTAFD